MKTTTIENETYQTRKRAEIAAAEKMSPLMSMKPEDFEDSATPHELARIAALLHRDPAETHAHLAERALALIIACEHALEGKRRRFRETWPKLVEIAQQCMSMHAVSDRPTVDPRQLKFPMKLDKFRRLMMPQYRGRTDEQGRVWRAFTESKRCLPGECVYFLGEEPNISDRKIIDFGPVMAGFDKNGILDEETFWMAERSFSAWFVPWQRGEISEKRRQAAHKRKPRPPVDQLPGSSVEEKKDVVRVLGQLTKERASKKPAS